MSRGVWDSPETLAWARRVVWDLVPKIAASHYFVTYTRTDGEADVKLAVELGFAVLMDKPIIALVAPGARVPNKLVLVADAIIEHDIRDADGVARKLREAIAELEGG